MDYCSFIYRKFHLWQTFLCILLFVASQVFSQGKVDQRYLPKVECGINIIASEGRENKSLTCPSTGICDDPDTRNTYFWQPSDGYIVIKTKVQVVRETDGTNPAATPREVAMQMHYLNKEFAPYGFQFTYKLEYIDNSNYRNISTTNEVLQLMNTYSTEKDKYCNIIVTAAHLSAAWPPWFSMGDVGLIMNRGVQFYPGNNRSSLTHEMAHSLGQMHTFYGYSEVACSDPCAENTSTADLDLCGDHCSDTPPQEVSFQHGFTQTFDACNNNMPFETIAHNNFLSYSDCKSTLTPQQVARMRCWTLNHPKRTGWIDTTNPIIPYIYDDNYGYTFTEENKVEDLNWVDISNIGQQVTGLADDNVPGPFLTGFDFNFYGENISQFYLGSNGYIALGPTLITTPNGPYPSIPTIDGNNGFIAPLLADLNVTGNGNIGKVYLYSNQIDSLVITYEHVPFYAQNTNGYSGDNTFQLILSAADTSITFQYLKMDEYYPPIFTQTTRPSIIGMENQDGSDGLEINNYQIPPDSSRIKIFLKGGSMVSAANDSQFTGEINIYPNPSNGNFTFDINTANHKHLHVEILDLNGRTLQTFEPSQVGKNNSKFEWGIPQNNGSVPSGIYLARIISGNQFTVKKLIVL